MSTQIFDAFLSVEKNEKKIFLEKNFFEGGRPQKLNQIHHLALAKHFDSLKMSQIDQIDVSIENIIEIKDRKRLVRFCQKCLLVVEIVVKSMI